MSQRVSLFDPEISWRLVELLAAELKTDFGQIKIVKPPRDARGALRAFGIAMYKRVAPVPRWYRRAPSKIQRSLFGEGVFGQIYFDMILAEAKCLRFAQVVVPARMQKPFRESEAGRNAFRLVAIGGSLWAFPLLAKQFEYYAWRVARYLRNQPHYWDLVDEYASAKEVYRNTISDGDKHIGATRRTEMWEHRSPESLLEFAVANGMISDLPCTHAASHMG